MKAEAPVIVLHCGGRRMDEGHIRHEWRWRKVVLDSDLTGETTPYRECPGPAEKCSFSRCPICGDRL